MLVLIVIYVKMNLLFGPMFTVRFYHFGLWITLQAWLSFWINCLFLNNPSLLIFVRNVDWKMEMFYLEVWILGQKFFLLWRFGFQGILFSKFLMVADACCWSLFLNSCALLLGVCDHINSPTFEWGACCVGGLVKSGWPWDFITLPDLVLKLLSSSLRMVF